MTATSTPNRNARTLRVLSLIALAIAFLVAVFTGFHITHGRAEDARLLHAWLGAGAGAALLVHLGRRWKWVRCALRSPPGSVVRRKLRWDLGLAVLLVLVVASGLLLEPGSAWRGLHHLTSKLLLFAAAGHAIHRRAAFMPRHAPATPCRGGDDTALPAEAQPR